MQAKGLIFGIFLGFLIALNARQTCVSSNVVFN